MQVQVHLYTVLKEKIPPGRCNPFIFTLREKSTIQDLLNDLQVDYDLEALAMIVNGKSASFDTVLTEGDLVDLVPAISGGSGIY
jgi:sulfur carrier protein ThiS